MNTNMTQPNKTTYANKLKQTISTPNKDQAVVMNAYNEFEMIDYLKPIGNIIGPKNIHFASKISNNRICIFLANKELVDQLIKDHSLIKIKEQEIIIRRLITPAIRIIFSNVYPKVPHYVLEKALQDKGIKLVSPINYLRTSEKDQEYSHLLSFKRQVYISSNSIDLPDSLEISHEDTNYRVYLSGENILCYKCKKPDIQHQNARKITIHE